MSLFKKKKKNEKTYKAHSIDNIIVKVLALRDKWTFWTKDKIFFFKELSYLIIGGVGITNAVELIYKHTDNFAVKEIAKNIWNYLHQWKSLSYALSRMPDYFNEWDFNIIKSGEKSWNLIVVLKSLSTEYGYLNTIKNKYIGALSYPVILLVVAFVSAIWLFLRVMPEVFSIVEGFQDIDLPWSTKILKFISDFIANQRKLLLIVWWIFIFSLSTFISTNTGKKWFFNLILEVPLIWKMTKYFFLIKRCRYMKIMLSAGMSYVEMFYLLRDIFGIPLYQEMIERIISWLERWESIYSTLKYEQKLIPVNVSTLIRVWEESANLTTSIENIVHIYEEELNTKIDGLSKIIEPIMLVLIWWLVLVISMWVFGIIFQVMEWAGI